MATVRFFNDLGAEVFVPVSGETPGQVRQAVLRTLREYGRMGWRSGEVPPGGFRFPLANEPDFDWHLIGGRRGTCTVDGEEREGVWYAGHFYTRREVVDEGDGSFRYVALATFRGEARPREEYRTPTAAGNGATAGAVVR
jgi:hypothetical protein